MIQEAEFFWRGVAEREAETAAARIATDPELAAACAPHVGASIHRPEPCVIGYLLEQAIARGITRIEGPPAPADLAWNAAVKEQVDAIAETLEGVPR